ncbi:asparaginase [Sandaracinus amylolyticus]|uniref:asparaginase n=1 Tax=Sandaracinus amylolyticus TaxID=927083 RepID=UPI001F35C6FF|nr:asparaginase [Sandaracinus amylolyticus]UJR82470.1 Hypothetical protein I5071_45350 [Sandaracinus amylolyticus]
MRKTVSWAVGLGLVVAGVAGSQAQRAEPSPRAREGGAEAAPDLPRVTILATGGTIAGTASGASAIGYHAGAITGEQLVAAAPGIDHLARITTEQVANVGSQDMNDEVWARLARRIDQIFDDGEADGVVVTHGTDTLEETAFFLENVLRSDRPVVLVGAMRPSSAISADGPANLYEAVEVAVSPDARGRGVLVVMNDTIHESRDVTKTHTTSVDTFRSPNAGPVGYVDPAAVRFVEPSPTMARPRFERVPSSLPRVAIVYAHSNMTAEDVRAVIATRPRGIVLAGVGDGNTSQEALGALRDAVRRGIVVVRSSRVGSGYTNRNVEVDDDEMGFVAALDLSPQKARILTQLLIANRITDAAAVQREFAVR